MKANFFNSMMSDIAFQDTEWRPLAQKCADYYDHLQITQSRLNMLKACETLDIIGNHIQPVVNSVLGHEEQSRVDWMVSADDLPSEEVAEALNQKVNEAMRLSDANRYCSEAYKHQIIKGIGWLHMRRNPDPFDANRYLIERIQTDEMFWDMRSRDQSLRDCRWVARRKFLDIDEAIVEFPQHAELIKACRDGSYGTGFEVGEHAALNAERYSEYQASLNYSSHVFQSVGGSPRQRIAIYEVYYRSLEKANILRFANGRIEEYQKDNPLHMIALLTQQAMPEKYNIKKMRRKWFIGPHEIKDEKSPHPHNYFPFVMFQGYVEDTRNVPYGIVRGMLDPQDAYNEAGFEMMNILQNVQIMKEAGTFGNIGMRDSELVAEVRRRDSVITTDDGKLGTLIITKEWQELQALNGLQEKYAQQIRDYSGVYNSYSGHDAKANSGVAIASLAELGATTLSEINANYQFARKKLGELMLAFVVADIGHNEIEVSIKEGSSTKAVKKIVLNRRDSERGAVTNAVAMARTQVVLADVHSSAGYRQHLNRRIMEMYQVTGADPVQREFLMEMAIETSELPNRGEYLEKWRKIKGIDDDPEVQKKMQEQQIQMQQLQAERDKSKFDAELLKINAAAQKDQAMAQEYLAKAGKETYEIERLKAEDELRLSQFKKTLIDNTWRENATRVLDAV